MAPAFYLIERLVFEKAVLKQELRALIAKKFRGLWTNAHMYTEIDRMSRQFATDTFWYEGWRACRQTMHFDKEQLSAESMLHLSALEVILRPANRTERVRAIFFGNISDWWDFDDEDEATGAIDRLEEQAYDLGSAVIVDEELFEEVLPDIFHGGPGAWAFGRGLVNASSNPRATWFKLIQGFERIKLEQRNVQVMRGFLAGLWENDQNLAESFLDSALDQPTLAVFFSRCCNPLFILTYEGSKG